MRTISRWPHALLVALMLLGAAFIYHYAIAATAGNPIGEVVWVKGRVEAISANHQVRVLKRKDVIFEHDILSTGSGGEGQLVFTDGGLLALRESTQFKIDEYRYTKTGDASDNKYVANLVKGGFRTITGAISKGHPENYRVSTPVATIGVRGTGYSAYCDEKSQCAFKLDIGEITVSNKNGELVLNEDKRYGEVPSIRSAPVSVSQPPGVFGGDPKLVPAQPSGTLTSSPSGGPSGGVTGSPSGPSGGGSSKTVSGFCIS